MSNAKQLYLDFSEGAPLAKCVPMMCSSDPCVESFDPETSLYFARKRDFREVAARQGITFRKGDPCAHCDYHGLCDCDGCAMHLFPLYSNKPPKINK